MKECIEKRKGIGHECFTGINIEVFKVKWDDGKKKEVVCVRARSEVDAVIKVSKRMNVDGAVMTTEAIH